MEKIRSVIAYEDHFEKFLHGQPVKVQNKIFKIIEAIKILQRVPTNYLKSITGVEGLFKARISLATNIWRIFCFFDEGRLVILLNGFTKKSQKTPLKEIVKARKLMAAYFKEKDNED